MLICRAAQGNIDSQINNYSENNRKSLLGVNKLSTEYRKTSKHKPHVSGFGL